MTPEELELEQSRYEAEEAYWDMQMQDAERREDEAVAAFKAARDDRGPGCERFGSER